MTNEFNLINEISEKVSKEGSVRISFLTEKNCLCMRSEISCQLWYLDFDIYQNCQGKWILEIQNNGLTSQEKLQLIRSQTNYQDLVVE